MNVTSLKVPDNQSTGIWRIENIIPKDSFKDGDTLMLTFKARLLSGGDNGKGYIKAQLQMDDSNKKAYKKKNIRKDVFQH